jgi:hypothetical protein
MFQGCVAGFACRNEWIRMDSRQNSQADESNCTSNWTPESERMKRKEKDSSYKRRGREKPRPRTALVSDVVWVAVGAMAGKQGFSNTRLLVDSRGQLWPFRGFAFGCGTVGGHY